MSAHLSPPSQTPINSTNMSFGQTAPVSAALYVPIACSVINLVEWVLVIRQAKQESKLSGSIFEMLKSA